MSLKVPSLDKLVSELSKLPGIGEKTAQRLAFYILKSSPSLNLGLRESLKGVAENIHPCPVCFSYTEESSECRICLDPSRDHDKVCVVEDPSDIARIESSGAFHGKYHVLLGSISPLEGIQPEDLKIQDLVQRIDSSSEIKEVILALDADLEGDTTALYLSRLLSEKVRITRIAHGVPFGTDIDYIDQRTLGRALENRVEL